MIVSLSYVLLLKAFLMILTVAQMGSANLNDRSQKGDGDSEIALVVEDTEEIESYMNGERVCYLFSSDLTEI